MLKEEKKQRIERKKLWKKTFSHRNLYVCARSGTPEHNKLNITLFHIYSDACYVYSSFSHRIFIKSIHRISIHKVISFNSDACYVYSWGQNKQCLDM